MKIKSIKTNATSKGVTGTIKVTEYSRRIQTVCFDVDTEGAFHQWGAPIEVLSFTINQVESIRNTWLEEWT